MIIELPGGIVESIDLRMDANGIIGAVEYVQQHTYTFCNFSHQLMRDCSEKPCFGGVNCCISVCRRSGMECSQDSCEGCYYD